MKKLFREKTFNSVSLLVIGAALVLVIAGIAYYVQQEKQKEAIDTQTNKTNELVLQVKALSEQNKQLNEQNRNYAYCTAVLLAKYTQDQRPIAIEDLDKCILSDPAGKLGSSPQSSGSSSPTNSTSSTSSTQTSTTTNNNTTTQQIPPVAEPTPSLMTLLCSDLLAPVTCTN